MDYGLVVQLPNHTVSKEGATRIIQRTSTFLTLPARPGHDLAGPMSIKVGSHYGTPPNHFTTITHFIRHYTESNAKSKHIPEHAT